MQIAHLRIAINAHELAESIREIIEEDRNIVQVIPMLDKQYIIISEPTGD